MSQKFNIRVLFRRKIEGRLQRGDSFSEPNLTTAGTGHETDRSGRHYTGFPPGFTVDELRWYRKKKPPGDGGPKDNLKTEDGSMKKFKSEYKRCFRHFKFFTTSSEDLSESQEELVEKRKEIRPLDYLKLEGDLEYRPEYRDLFIEYPSKPEDRLPGTHARFQSDGPTDTQSGKKHQSVPRIQLIRRSTNLQREGEFMVKSSEMHSQFVKHEAKRADVTRRPTSLRLEGEMAVTSETADKFVEFLKETRERPDPIKAPTNLKLEGEMDVLTEKNEKYVPFDLPKRIPLTKQPTNLHLEGPMEMETEKQDKYVPFNVQERASLIKRQTNLQLEGNMDIISEKQEQFVPHNIEKRTPMLKRDTNLQLEGEMETQTEKKEKYVPFELSTRQKIQKRPTNLQLDGEMIIQTEKSAKHVPFELQKRAPLAKKDTNLQLEGDFVLNPEYRQEFIEHHIDRVKPKRPVNNLGIHIDDNVVTGQKKDSFFEEYRKPYRPFEASLRFDHDIKPSYKENYIPHKMEKTASKKPKENLKPEGAIDLITETQTKFTQHDTKGKKLGEGQSEVEHKNKSVSFPRKAVRQAEEIALQEVKQKRTRGHAQAGTLKPEGHMESVAEYKSSFVDFPRERPIIKKPEDSLRSEGHVSHLSEKSSAYVAHGHVTRPALARREDSLKMDDSVDDETAPADPSDAAGSNFECQPEYRKAYNDYLQRENLTRKPRKLLQEIVTSESKIPLPKSKRQSSKSPTLKPSTASTTKSRSVSPPDRRRRRPVPRTPLQQSVLVPNMGEFTPRRPSSIFGPKTGRWYPRAVSPTPGASCAPVARHCSDDEWECGSHARRSRCSPCCDGCHRCHSRTMSRWESPCGRRDFHCEHPSPRCHSPSPPRRSWSRDHEFTSHHATHHGAHQPHQATHQLHSILRTEEKPASFVVLTDKVEINNNRLQTSGVEAAKTSGGGGQKWMPPWYEPPM